MLVHAAISQFRRLHQATEQKSRRSADVAGMLLHRLTASGGLPLLHMPPRSPAIWPIRSGVIQRCWRALGGISDGNDESEIDLLLQVEKNTLPR